MGIKPHHVCQFLMLNAQVNAGVTLSGELRAQYEALRQVFQAHKIGTGVFDPHRKIDNRDRVEFGAPGLLERGSTRQTRRADERAFKKSQRAYTRTKKVSYGVNR